MADTGYDGFKELQQQYNTLQTMTDYMIWRIFLFADQYFTRYMTGTSGKEAMRSIAITSILDV
ncbi:hypothetical protein DM790_18520 [Flavobacterium collinsii]|nr:hypothetical protein [Flavobacterium collinsii]